MGAHASLFTQVITLVRKDAALEFRQKQQLFSLLLYVGSTVFVCYLSFYLKTKQLDSITWNAVFWIILLFVAIQSTSKSFAERSERNYYYYYVVSAEAILLSKVIYNFVLLLALALATVALMLAVLHVEIGNVGLFLANIVIGTSSLSANLSLLAAIASKTRQNQSLMAVMSLPVLVPMLILLVKVSNIALDGLTTDLALDELAILGAINMLLLAVSYILFPYIWRT